MFGMDSSKLQGKQIPSPDNLGEDVIISPDTRRENRIPPRQSRTLKWPVLDASGAPSIDLAKWRFSIEGLVAKPISWTWEEFQALPRVKVFADFHCVTRWSRLGNLWEGVSVRELVDRAGGLRPNARFAVVYGYDYGWTTNLPVEQSLGARMPWSPSPMTASRSVPSTAVRRGSSCRNCMPGRAPSGWQELSSAKPTRPASGSRTDTTCAAIHGKKSVLGPKRFALGGQTGRIAKAP